MQILPLIVMGATAILMQIAMLRQLLTVFSGNELVIGVILSVWLTAVGAGSLLGRKIKSPSVFPLSFFLTAILSQTMILAALLVRPMLSFEFGETISLPATIIAAAALLLPLCLLTGIQFPLAVSYLQGRTSLVYGFEALGSLAGGIIFTFLLAGKMDILTLALSIASINILAGILLAGNRRLLFLILVPFLLYFVSLRAIPPLAWKGGQLIERVESRYGEIMTMKTGEQMNIFTSGKFAFAYPDPQTEETKIHTAVSMHADPKAILLIGGSPALIRETLKYAVEKVDFVEIDPKMVDISLGILTGADRQKIRDRRVTLLRTDARRLIRTTPGKTYDLILLNLPEPSTAHVNRFYTAEFFAEAKQKLNQGGLLLLSLPTSSGYVGRRMQMLQSTVYHSIKQAFPYLQVSSEEYGIICGSDRAVQADPITLQERFHKRSIRTAYFVSSLFADIFSPMKTDRLRTLLEGSTGLNTDMKPAAYRYSLMLWLESQGSYIPISLLEHGGEMAYVFIALITVCGILLFRKKQVVSFSVFISGYAAMASSITLMLAYQAIFGYMYEMLGLLTALFMAGMAAGAYVSKDAAEPLRWMRGAGILSIALLLTAPLLLRSEVFFFMMSFLTGMIAGAEFIAADQLSKKQTAELMSGKLYGIDLIGSFFGALLTSLVIVPLMGIQISLLVVALLKMVLVTMLIFYTYEKT